MAGLMAAVKGRRACFHIEGFISDFSSLVADTWVQGLDFLRFMWCVLDLGPCVTVHWLPVAATSLSDDLAPSQRIDWRLSGTSGTRGENIVSLTYLVEHHIENGEGATRVTYIKTQANCS